MTAPSRTAVFLVPGSYDTYRRKGVAGMIAERDEFGFFSHVFTVHFPANRNQRIQLGQRHTVIDYAPGVWYAALQRVGLGIIAGAISTVRMAFTISWLVRRQRVSLLRAMNSQEHGFCGHLIHLLTGIPWCVSIHADYDKRFALSGGTPGVKRAIYQRIEHWVLSHAPLVLVIRKSLIPYALHHGAMRARIRLIPHGADLSRFIAAPQRGFLKRFGLVGRKLLVFAGRLSKENYVHDLIPIAADLARADPAVQFIILGDGPERVALRAEIRNRGLARRFRFLGYQPRDVVAEFRKRAAVNLCLMGGHSLIEAAAAARPTIAYDVEWHHELIQNGISGYLVPEHDAAAVARRVLALLRNPPLANVMGVRARTLALKNHDLHTASARKVAVYRELLETHG